MSRRAGCFYQFIQKPWFEYSPPNHLTWLDADDIYDPDRIEYLLEEATSTGADIVCDNSRFIDEGGEELPGGNRVPDHIAADPCFTRLFERNYMSPHALISRRCYQAVDYDTSLPGAEDYDFWLKSSGAGFIFRRLDDTKISYRITTDSLSSNTARCWDDNRRIITKYSVRYLMNLYRSRNYSQDIINYMACLQHIYRGNFSEALTFTNPPWPVAPDIDRHFYRGTLALKTGNKNMACNELLTHLETTPNSPAGYNNLGVFHCMEHGDGMKYFKKAVDLFPAYNDAQINLTHNEDCVLTLTQTKSNKIR